MAYVVMAQAMVQRSREEATVDIVMVYMVMAIHSYGLHSSGVYSYTALYSYGLI